jgi:histone H3/H4
MKVFIIIMLLRKGIEEYEKNTLNFIAEYLNTYILDILTDSKQNALYAERHKINIDDIK